MGRKLKDVLEDLPARRRAAIESRADAMVGEMIEASLKEVREATHKTQAQIAAIMGVPQNAISQLESRSDPKLSTMARYARALGAELDVIVRVGKEVFSVKQPARYLATATKPSKARASGSRVVLGGGKAPLKAAKRPASR